VLNIGICGGNDGASVSETLIESDNIVEDQGCVGYV